jgi:hypothetical protein
MAKTNFSSLFAQDSTFVGSFTFQNEAMSQALKKAQEAKTQRLAETAASLFENIERTNTLKLTALRNVRKQEKAAKEALDNFTEAVQCFMDTGNFGPLYPYMPHEVSMICSKLGVDLPTVEEQKIPEKKTPA